MVIEGYIIKDTGTKVVLLPRGTFQLGSGKYVDNENSYNKLETVVESFEGIRKVSLKNVISHYESPDGSDRMMVSMFGEQEADLLSKRRNYDEGYEWDSLEDEFAYKAFKRDWIPVYREIITYSDAIPVEIKGEGVLETGNKFIKSAFSRGDKIENIGVYEYHQASAWHQIVRDKMESLGLTYVLGDAREGMKEWSNSNHSVLEYLRMGGSYVWNRQYSSSHIHKGTLEKLQAMYEKDKSTMEKLLDQKYYQLFGRFQDNKTELVKQAITKASSAMNALREVDPKAKTYDAKRRATKHLEDVINLLKDSFIED